MTSVTVLIVFNFCLFTLLENIWPTTKSLLKSYCYLFTCVGRGVQRCLYRGQRSALGTQFSPSTTRVLGIKLRFSGLVPSVSTHWAISLACQMFLSYLIFLVLPRKLHILLLFSDEIVGIKHRASSLLGKPSTTEKYHNLFICLHF